MEYFELEKKIVVSLKTLLILTPAVSLIASIGHGSLTWLKYGYWQELTSCATFNLFCYSNTKFIGVNIILDWFGRNDITFVIALICLIVFIFLPDE